jgi:hypothetical protein
VTGLNLYKKKSLANERPPHTTNPLYQRKRSRPIEAILKTDNPLPYPRIKSHVTLCREDELAPLDDVIRNLHTLQYRPLTIGFGAPVRFSDGKGV